MKLVFAGNRQCQFAGDVFRSLVSDRPDISVAYVDDDGDLRDQSVDAIRSADILVLQERDAPRNFAVDALNQKADHFSIPDISVDFLWPFGGQPHVLNRPGQDPPGGPFPTTLGDAYLNRRIETHFSPGLLVEYVCLRIDHLIDLDGYRDIVLERQGRIDRATGTDWASAIRDNLRTRPMFYNPLHPAPWVLGEMLSRLMSTMNLKLYFTESDISRVCAVSPELPIHPSVARHFNLTWAPERRLYRMRDGDFTSFSEYVRRYLAYAEAPDADADLQRRLTLALS